MAPGTYLITGGNRGIERRIRVNAVIPGFVATDLTSGLPEHVVKGLRSTAGLPDGVGLDCSERAPSITGQTLVVNAGTSA